MHIKSILIVLIIGAVYLHESEAVPKPFGLIKAKVAAVKTKLALAKAPKLIAAAVIAKGVKAKAKIAAAKAAAAAKAVKVAAVAAITAPIKIAKAKVALKVAGVKALKAVKIAKVAKTAAALKALKIAKIAKTGAVLKKLKKKPIVIPIPVPLPPLPSLPSLPSFPNPFAGPTSTPAPVQTAEPSNPIQGFFSGITKAFQG